MIPKDLRQGMVERGQKFMKGDLTYKQFTEANERAFKEHDERRKRQRRYTVLYVLSVLVALPLLVVPPLWSPLFILGCFFAGISFGSAIGSVS